MQTRQTPAEASGRLEVAAALAARRTAQSLVNK